MQGPLSSTMLPPRRDPPPGRFCSLIPGFGVKLSAIILAGPTVLSAVGACPPHDGVRRRWWINVASAVSLMRARKNSGDLTTAIVPAGTSFPARAGSVISLLRVSGGLLRRPVELGPVDPHSVQNDSKLSSDGNLGFAQPASLRKPDAPGFERRPFCYPGEQHIGCLVEVTSQQLIAAFRDSAGPVDLPDAYRPVVSLT